MRIAAENRLRASLKEAGLYLSDGQKLLAHFTALLAVRGYLEERNFDQIETTVIYSILSSYIDRESKQGNSKPMLDEILHGTTAAYVDIINTEYGIKISDAYKLVSDSTRGIFTKASLKNLRENIRQSKSSRLITEAYYGRIKNKDTLLESLSENHDISEFLEGVQWQWNLTWASS